MTVKDYAMDVNLSVAEVLKECAQLDIKVKSAEDLLSEDDFIMLDNAINLISTDEEITYDEDEEIEDKVEEIISNNNMTKNLPKSGKKEKIKKKDNTAEQFKKGRKELYKNKAKLQKNGIDNSQVVFTKGMTLYAFAESIAVNPAEIIKKLIPLGLMIGINDALDIEVAQLIADEYKKVIKTESTTSEEIVDDFEVFDNEKDLVKRPPVVTIMGHVDHGKTSLLDYIRKSKIASGEAGGITQGIGAYKISYNDEDITFIDTPGHAAFTGMRARGASITDIVIIIVAADDGVMPQTKEAVEHALAANVPIIIAVNKVDKENANVDKVMTEMAELNITPEAWGGEYPFINISAKTGEGVDYLLDTICTTALMKEYKANPKRYAVGTVIESKVDKNVGGVVSFLIQNGTLRLGDPVVVGTSYAKVRTMKNDLGESILEAGPSTPVEITGISVHPEAGDKFMSYETESEAKKIAEKRLLAKKALETEKKVLTLEDLFASVNSDIKEIKVVLKADVKGSEEAIKASLSKLSVGNTVVKVIRSSIGAISESDVTLASTSGAVILAFNLPANNMINDFAKGYKVEIRHYNIIYKLIEDIESKMNGMQEDVYEEKALGKAEVRKIFKFSKVGNIAGSFITDGLIKKGALCRVHRNNEIIKESTIQSIQREKDSVKEVKKGYECGITVEDFPTIKEGDIIEVYENVLVEK